MFLSVEMMPSQHECSSKIVVKPPNSREYCLECVCMHAHAKTEHLNCILHAEQSAEVMQVTKHSLKTQQAVPAQELRV